MMGLPPRVYDASGRLTLEAITALVRRVWWAEPSDALPVEVDRSDPMSWQKSTRLTSWYGPARWPSWWQCGRWMELEDGFQVFVDGTLLESWLSVRRAQGRRRISVGNRHSG